MLLCNIINLGPLSYVGFFDLLPSLTLLSTFRIHLSYNYCSTLCFLDSHCSHLLRKDLVYWILPLLIASDSQARADQAICNSHFTVWHCLELRYGLMIHLQPHLHLRQAQQRLAIVAQSPVLAQSQVWEQVQMAQQK